MNALPRLLLTASMTTCFLASPASAQEGTAASLNGEWVVVFCLRAGEDRGWSESLRIEGTRFSATHGKPVGGTLVIDARATPKTIDLNYDPQSGPYSGTKVQGIYRFQGADVLIINLGLGAAENERYPRPAKFDAGPKSSLLVLVRKKAP